MTLADRIKCVLSSLEDNAMQRGCYREILRRKPTSGVARDEIAHLEYARETILNSLSDLISQLENK